MGAETAVDSQLRDDNTREVVALVREQGGVVLGRNATLILADRPKTLHVRLVAPAEVRAARAAEAAGISVARARVRQRNEDSMRRQIAMEVHQWDPTDDEYFDIIINTGTASEDEAVDLIVHAFGIQTQ